MESLALQRGKRKCQKPQYDTDKIIDLSVQQPPQDKAQKKTANAKMHEKVLPPPHDHPGTSAKEKARENEYSTSQTLLQEARQTIERQKGENATLKEWIDMLTEERNFLRERLKEALMLKNDRRAETAIKISPVKKQSGRKKDDSDETDLSSSNESSDSEADTASSEDKKPKKSKSKRKTKKLKKMRVKTPDHSIQRYNMVLEMVRNDGISKAEAYARLGVDRNTIVYQAPIAELAATNHELYKTLRSTFKRKDSLKRFAETCKGFCEQEPTASAIQKKKEAGSLLDIYKK